MSAHQLHAAPRASHHPSIIALTGLRASGKTTIGRALAGHLNWTFIDVDDLTIARLGATSVTEAWQRLGEQAWRDAEVEALHDVLQRRSAVIALGGGTLTSERAQHMVRPLQASGTLVLVYLHCAPNVLIGRLQRDPRDRPRLTALPLEEEVRAVYEQRDPTYRSIADLIIDTGTTDPQQVVQRLVERYGLKA